MRKLLAILLIATIACNGLFETFESLYEDMNLDYFGLDKEFVELAMGLLYPDIHWEKVKETVDLFKANGIWDKLESSVKANGKKTAKDFCDALTQSQYCFFIVYFLIR